jgi:adenylate cyclase
VVISQAGLLVYAQQDPRFLTTENFREAVLGEAVHLNNYILSMGIIGTLGFFLAYLTFRVRRTVLLAVKNELKIQKLNSHFSPETMSEIRKQTEDILPIGGKEIKVAVMYCDIVGFTPLSESIGVAKTMELLTAYHGFVLERIFEFKGTLDHFRGDGMYISFGTPFSTGFDAENALLSGLSIFDKLKDFNSEREKEGEKSIQLRIVIHFGSVLFGNTGQQENAEFTVIGEAVTIVNRLEGYAKESKKSFLVSKDLIAEIPNFNSLGIKTVAMSSLPAKGKQRSIDVISIEKKL